MVVANHLGSACFHAFKMISPVRPDENRGKGDDGAENPYSMPFRLSEKNTRI